MRIMSLLFLIVLSAASSMTDTLAPQTLDSLYSHAAFVGILKIETGFFASGKGAIYEAMVLRVFKGDSVSHLFLGPFVGSRIGCDYVVFLFDPRETVAQHWSKEFHRDDTTFQYLSRSFHRFSGNLDSSSGDVNGIEQLPEIFDRNAKFYAQMFEGFGIIPIDYTLEFHSYAAKIACSHVILPPSINRKPIPGTDNELWEDNWVDLEGLKKYLIQRRTNPK